MDQLSLLNLLSNSTKKLASLHEQLGHPPHRLEEAIQSLHNVLEAAVQGQLDNVQKEVDDAQDQIKQGQDDIVKFKTALGEEVPTASSQSPPLPSSAGHSRSASHTRKASSDTQQPTEVSTQDSLTRHRPTHSLTFTTSDLTPIATSTTCPSHPLRSKRRHLKLLLVVKLRQASRSSLTSGFPPMSWLW